MRSPSIAPRAGKIGILLASLIPSLIGVGAETSTAARAETGRACAAQASSRVGAARLGFLARGFNLTGWLDGPTVRRPDLTVLARLRERGFSHIRLPVMAEHLMEAFSNRDHVAWHVGELDRAIDALIGLGFGVSLDLHPGGRFGRLHVAEPDKGLELLAALWRSLAQRYADRPAEMLFFEVLNEPGVAIPIWNRQGPLLVQAIRREASRHTIIYGPAHYQRIDVLSNMAPLPDDNVVYAAHFYDPMIFTHQGADWSDEDPLRYVSGVPFPVHASDDRIVALLARLTGEGRIKAGALVLKDVAAPWTEERVANAIAQAADWATRHRRPVIINEFGVLGWKAAPLDRARWLRAVRTAAEHHCIGWTHWDYADGFGFVRRVDGREIPDEAIVDALLGGRSSAAQR
jgi:endoglucanase